MSTIDRLILKIKRADTPVFRALKMCARMLSRPQAPVLPSFFRPVLRSLYELHFLAIQTARLLMTVLYRHLLFQGRCASIGKNVAIDGMPFVVGHAEITIGDNVCLGGGLEIMTGRFVQSPRLVIKDNAELGWNVRITVNREVTIEEHVRISYDCRISDSDGHPRDANLRRENAPMDLNDIRPVRICRDAWIGNGTHIMKGVTIGEGAIIGANSVVIADVPAFSLAFGNPAEVYFKNYGKPKPRQKSKTETIQELLVERLSSVS